MRAVARAAGTNTPAVYRRFRDRDDILRAMLQRIRFDLAAALKSAPSTEDASRPRSQTDPSAGG